MAVLLNRLSHRRLPALAAAFRQHGSLTKDLIENMDKKETWDRFYRENNAVNHFKNFEWFFGFEGVRDVILPVLRAQARHSAPLRVLDMGCGTSALGSGLCAHSQQPLHVTCADISPVALHLLREQAKNKPVQPKNPGSTLAFVELDCCDLRAWFEPESLDLIVDKGTTDALLRSREGPAKAGRVLRQCLAVLRPSGCLLQFSDEDPDARLVWLESESGGLGAGAAGVRVQEVGTLRGVCYFCYLITPPSPAAAQPPPPGELF
ncbi:hypothetical protein AAFF_G00294890 [Aldrovandia affinis]|uniref:Citrate synthase-lysine N-methyltransferase CSKMT, mitochondrial n=1 Tax=Aldrovandia affinis TaxID=143900 RepID=A0AAD7R9L2_9TELE|nr:hypothetical protein AAFF_G00294890 [Aldrovandia affinis]